MPPVRRSTRAPRQHATDTNGTGAAGPGSGSDAAPARKPKRPRASPVAKTEPSDLEPSEEVTGKNQGDDTDGVDEPDFAESDDENDDSVKPANKRLRKATASEIASKRKASKASGMDASVELESNRTVIKKESISLQSIPKKDSIPRRKQNEPVSQSLLLASLKPAPDTATITTSSKPVSSSTAPASFARKHTSSFPKQAAPTAPATASSSRAIGGIDSEEGGSLPATISIQVQGSSRQQTGTEPEGANEVNQAIGSTSGSTIFGQRQQVHSQLTSQEKQTMNSFIDLCRSIKESDGRFRNMGSVLTVDLGGSFLSRNDADDSENMDFFDRNDRGEIVLQPRLPMFPEDFPPGMKDHSLAWWGIQDPKVGEPFNNSRSSPQPNAPSRTLMHSETDPSDSRRQGSRALGEGNQWNGSSFSDVTHSQYYKDHHPKNRHNSYRSGGR